MHATLRCSPAGLLLEVGKSWNSLAIYSTFAVAMPRHMCGCDSGTVQSAENKHGVCTFSEPSCMPEELETVRMKAPGHLAI